VKGDSCAASVRSSTEDLPTPEREGLDEVDVASVRVEGKLGYALYRDTDPRLREERRALLAEPGVAFTEPLIEPILLPLFARLLAEIEDRPPEPELHRWWDESVRGRWRPSRPDGGKPPAIRSVVLYPTNALVEDQMAPARPMTGKARSTKRRSSSGPTRSARRSAAASSPKPKRRRRKNSSMKACPVTSLSSN